MHNKALGKPNICLKVDGQQNVSIYRLNLAPGVEIFIHYEDETKQIQLER